MVDSAPNFHKVSSGGSIGAYFIYRGLQAFHLSEKPKVLPSTRSSYMGSCLPPFRSSCKLGCLQLYGAFQGAVSLTVRFRHFVSAKSQKHSFLQGASTKVVVSHHFEQPQGWLSPALGSIISCQSRYMGTCLQLFKGALFKGFHRWRMFYSEPSIPCSGWLPICRPWSQSFLCDYTCL